VNRLYSAYVGAFFAPNNGSGVQIERLGAVEVRLICGDTVGQRAGNLDRAIRSRVSIVDSFRCESLDEAELLLEQLMRSAPRLTEPPTYLGPRHDYSALGVFGPGEISLKDGTFANPCCY
jgi:hypothetical protein